MAVRRRLCNHPTRDANDPDRRRPSSLPRDGSHPARGGGFRRRRRGGGRERGRCEGARTEAGGRAARRAAPRHRRLRGRGAPARERVRAGDRAGLQPRRRRLRRRDHDLRRTRLRPEGGAVGPEHSRPARVSPRALALAIAVAVVEVAAGLALVLTSEHEQHKAATAAFALTAGISFIASGLVALHRRPENRTGLYLAAVGYLWFLGALADANNDVLFTIGVALNNLPFVPFALLVLAFPTGRLSGRADRGLVAAIAALVTVELPLQLLVNDHPLP